MKKIGLLMVGLLVFGQAEFKRGDNDLTVIDTDTQLEWQDSYEDNNIKSGNWNYSITYCEDLKLDDKNDWRLPNINELKSIVMETQYEPTIDEKFKYTKNHYYRSSTTRNSSTSYQFIINFTNGFISFAGVYDGYYIRCVRDAEN